VVARTSSAMASTAARASSAMASRAHRGRARAHRGSSARPPPLLDAGPLSFPPAAVLAPCHSTCGPAGLRCRPEKADAATPRSGRGGRSEEGGGDTVLRALEEAAEGQRGGGGGGAGDREGTGRGR